MKTSIEVFNRYNTALESGKVEEAVSLFSPNVIWHQPGKNILSGDIQGVEALGAHLGRFYAESNGTFKITTNWAAENENLVSANVLFEATKEGHVPLSLAGTDLFRIEDGLIQEVWLFTINQEMEDQFWGLS